MLAAAIGLQPGERGDLAGRGVGLARLPQRNQLDSTKLAGRAIGGQPDLAESAAAHRADQIEVGHLGRGLRWFRLWYGVLLAHHCAAPILNTVTSSSATVRMG